MFVQYRSNWEASWCLAEQARPASEWLKEKDNTEEDEKGQMQKNEKKKSKKKKKKKKEKKKKKNSCERKEKAGASWRV